MNEGTPTPAPYAELIDQMVRNQRQAFRDSFLGQQQTLEELAEVWEECRTEDWDRFGAHAVDPETLRGAYCLIESLPLGFPRPSIGAEPDGHLTLEWRKSQRRVLSVSVDPSGSLHYAGLYGTNKRYGTLTFFWAAPVELLQLVRDL